jgi:CRP-like cAMP-binding protein
MHWGADAPFCEEHRETYDTDRFLTLLEPSEMIVATRFLLRKKARGGPITLQLMHAIADFGGQNGVDLIFCDCQPHLISMYQAVGMRPYHGSFNDHVVGIVIPVVLVGPDVGYSKRIGSPLAPAYEDYQSRVPLEDLLALIPETPSIRTMSAKSDAALWQDVQDKLTVNEKGKGAFLVGLDDEQIEGLFRHSHVLESEKGDRVIGRGQVTRTMFFVLEGVLEVKYDGRVVNVLTPGDCAGEISFLHEVPRSADIYAASDGVRLLSLSESSIRKLLETDASAAYQLMLNLAQSLAKKLIDREGY